MLVPPRRVSTVGGTLPAGRERNLDDLSDGQRSIFHIALTAAILDVESRLIADKTGFQSEGITLPTLTLLAVEEPENNLAPFYLARIIAQIRELTANSRAQAIVSSHSPSILARVEPEDIRHFQLHAGSRTSRVQSIQLPSAAEDASKFVREAVRTYPELYFARFVILGEGSTEEIVLPRVAEAMGLPIDRSFVAIVPLGGRHVNHLWRLLIGLGIPFATLLDFDYGRHGGGWGRVRTVVEQLIAFGVEPTKFFTAPAIAGGLPVALDALAKSDPKAFDVMRGWVSALRGHGVFFSAPLDIDMSMLLAFPAEYRMLETGMKGPAEDSDAKPAVLGKDGAPELYETALDDDFRWYRYLFLGRGKPSTHVRVLTRINSANLAARTPEELRLLLAHVATTIGVPPKPPPEPAKPSTP